MNIKETNRQIKSLRMHFKTFPGAKLTQCNHYVTPTLEEYRYDHGMMRRSYMLALTISRGLNIMMSEINYLGTL